MLTLSQYCTYVRAVPALTCVCAFLLFFHNRAKSEGRFGGVRTHVYVFLTGKFALAGLKGETTGMKCGPNVLYMCVLHMYIHTVCTYVRMYVCSGCM